MEQSDKEDFLTVPRLAQVPYLIHGFGTGEWKAKDFRRKKEWKDFKLVFLDQIHSNLIQGIDRVPRKKLRGDAMVTDLSFLLLIINTADCLPVLVFDESRKVIAAVHCGWRGTSKRVIQEAIQEMKRHYGSEPSSLLVALGPCIGPECYEVGQDVFENFKSKGHSTEFFRDHPFRERKYLFDLRGANLFQLQSLGVKEENVSSIETCTHCHPNFRSYRRDKNKAGRMMSFIGMGF